ncbi:MAG TPA: hypothetical protein VLG50_08275 [Candidatus Saccharimonadales bacterium]|nr:hypothetical protein [Candidatus Saccharimonadales bacterium]
MIDDYVDRGGQCVIILGECGDLTTDPEKFLHDDRWDTVMYEVPAAASFCPETLSINTRK